MHRSQKGSSRSDTNNISRFYFLGIGTNVLISLVHGAYAFAAFNTINEPALWFFSGALAVFFNAALNLLCCREYTKRSYITSMTANISLLVFMVFLSFTVREVHIACIAIIILYTTVFCYLHNRRMQNVVARETAR